MQLYAAMLHLHFVFAMHVFKVPYKVTPCIVFDSNMQAEKDAGPPDIEEEGVGNWFSNPAGTSNSTSTAIGSGVGKYLSSIPQKPNTQLATECVPEIQAAPAVKKQKLKQAGYGNFDAW